MNHHPKPLMALLAQYISTAAVIVALLWTMLASVLAATPDGPKGPEAAHSSVMAAITNMHPVAVAILGIFLLLMVVRAVWLEITYGTMVATLIAMAVLLPGVAALSTVVLYLLKEPSNYALLWGSVIALLLWFIAAVSFHNYATPAHVVPSSFDEIRQRLAQLQAQLSIVGPNAAVSSSTAVDVARQEADEQKARIDEELGQKGLQWVLATGYIHIWKRLHYTEEALIEVQPAETVIAGALYDELRLEGSNINHCQELLAKLRRAAEAIDPSARKYLQESASTAPQPLAITSPATMIDGLVGGVWSATLAASGGTPPYNWTPSAGSLPAWLTLSAVGALSGTPPAPGTCRFTARVTDGANATATQEFTLTVRALGISTNSPLPEATVGVAYSTTLVAAGGTAPYNWSISAGALPSGLALSPAGVLSGTPTIAGTSGFSVQGLETGGQNAPKEFTLTVKPAPAAAAGAVAMPVGQPDGNADRKTLARAVLRTIRHTINEFRDERWNALVVARNRLAGTMIFTGLTAYVLLAIALLREVDPRAITGASVFYLVGAVTGLVQRLYAESQTETAVEDYGLSTVRLLSTPLISGLVAIAGVVLVASGSIATNVFTQMQLKSTESTVTKPTAPPSPTATTATTPAIPTTPAPPTVTTILSLEQIFDLSHNLVGLLVAAVFGLTPSLLFNRLQKQAENYKADLKTSAAIQSPPRT